jgi:hypothetical protein
MISIEWCLLLCCGFAMFGWILGWISNSDNGSGGFM